MKSDDFELLIRMAVGIVSAAVLGILLLWLPGVERWRAVCAFALAFIFVFMTIRILATGSRKNDGLAEKEGRKSP